MKSDTCYYTPKFLREYQGLDGCKVAKKLLDDEYTLSELNELLEQVNEAQTKMIPEVNSRYGFLTPPTILLNAAYKTYLEKKIQDKTQNV